jgi:hypothetical protein
MSDMEKRLELVKTLLIAQGGPRADWAINTIQAAIDHFRGEREEREAFEEAYERAYEEEAERVDAILAATAMENASEEHEER